MKFVNCELLGIADHFCTGFCCGPLSHSLVILFAEGNTCQETKQPLVLWRMCLWVSGYSCYLSNKRGDLVNMADHLALCLVMLNVVSEGMHRKWEARFKCLAREVNRAAEHGDTKFDPGPACFQASSSTNLPPQLEHPAQETRADPSGPPQPNVAGSSHELPARIPPGVGAVGGTTWKRSASPGGQKTQLQRSLTTSDDEQEALSTPPSSDSMPADFGPGPPTPPAVLDPPSNVSPEQEENEGNNARRDFPSDTGRGRSGRDSVGTLPPRNVSKQVKTSCSCGTVEDVFGSPGSGPLSLHFAWGKEAWLSAEQLASLFRGSPGVHLQD
jgi:hypothetical protein